jgi:hypothetical protein
MSYFSLFGAVHVTTRRLGRLVSATLGVVPRHHHHLHIMFGFLRSLAVPLPTFGIALPANIQRRFLSFVLKYFLGHLVKPGQLDDHKIDAQIGSGRVEIKDVELDDSVSAF